MRRIIAFIFRTGIVIYTVFKLFNIKNMIEYPIDTPREIGQFMGVVFFLYLTLTFLGHQIVQVILILKEEDSRKIKYVSISGFIWLVCLLAYSIYALISTITVSDISGSLIPPITYALVLIYLTVLDLKIIKQKTDK